jgi:c-di-GMP phosphodiesterase
MERIFIGRQPILDRDGNLYAYELLHRRRGAEHASGDGDQMSSDMLLNAALEADIQTLSPTRPAFINVTRNLLLNGCLDSISPDRIGLEVLETVTVDQKLLSRLRVLRNRGFKIALDDFVCSPERTALIDCADIVKLDVLALDDRALERNVHLLKSHSVQLLAEKVETSSMHTRVRDLGFNLFQGYFFARPATYSSRRIPTNKLVLMQLLARINDPNATPEELGSIIRSDVSMAVTVLRWANSPLLGLRRPVESVERAVVVLGLYTIRNWVSLLALARMGAVTTELHTTILVRARTCELLATAMGRRNASNYFTVGLLSALDVILEIAMEQALDYLPLGAQHKAALLTRSGDLGAALGCVLAMESGSDTMATFATLDTAEITRCYLSAIGWVEHLGIADD